jgi:hypothetical protein
VRREDGHVRVEGTFTVPYVAWGLRDYSNFVLRVAPTVDVQLDVVGRLAGAAPADDAVTVPAGAASAATPAAAGPTAR